MENVNVIEREETLEEMKERLDREHVVREEEHEEFLKQIERVEKMMWENFRQSTINLYRLEKINEQLEDMVKDTKELRVMSSEMVGKR